MNDQGHSIQTTGSVDRFTQLVQGSIEARAQGSPDRAKQPAVDAIEVESSGSTVVI